MTHDSSEFERECAAMQARVFSTVAHDLKTPLACIIGSLETIQYLREQLPSEKRDELIASALDQAKKLNARFDSMLNAVQPV